MIAPSLLAASNRAPNPYGGNTLPVLPGSLPVTRVDEDTNPERSAPLTGNGASVAPTTQPVTQPGRPRRLPTIPSRPAHIAGVTLEGRQVSLAPQLDSIVSALRAGNLYVRPLGQLGHEPEVKTVVTPFTATMYSYAFVTQAGIYAPHLGTDLVNTNYVDGSSLTMVGTEIFNGVSVSLSGLLADGWAGSYLTFNIAQPANYLLSLGIQMQFWKDYFRLGGSFVHANVDNLTFVAASVLGAINVTRSATDLGAYGGPDAEDLAKTHGLNYARDGLRQVEIRQMFNKTLSVRAAGGSFTIAGLARLDYVHGRQTVFRTLVSTKDAQRIVFEGKGLKQYFIDRFRAMGLMKEIIPIPNQHATDTFREGDEIIKTTSGTVTTSAIVGNLTAFAGLQGFRRNDLEVTAHKLDNDHIEVVFNPTHLRDVGTYMYSPFGPEADIGRGHATSYRQSFIFDLREPEAHKAYHAALDGKLPNALHKYKPTPEQQRGELPLKETVRQQNAELPKGVTRSYIHLIRSTEHRGGFGGYWRLIPRIFLPSQWTNILATHRNRVHELQAISDGNLIDCADNRFSQRRNELLWYGLRTAETAAQRRHFVDDKDKRTFYGLTLESTLYDGCMRGLAANREFVQKVNDLFEKEYGLFKRPGHKQQREVDIVRMFAPKEIDALADYAKLWKPDLEEPLSRAQVAMLTARLHRGCMATHMRFRPVRAMLIRLARQAPGDERAAVAQRFVQAHGMRAFALINKLMPDERNLMVSTTSSTYQNSLQRTARMALMYHQPLRGGDSPRDVRQRFKDVTFALGRLQRALADLNDDPLLGPDREVLRSELLEAQEVLYALLRIEYTESDVLIGGLKMTKPRWHHSADQIMLYTLEDPQRWVRQADALAAVGQDRPLPRDAKTLARRWQETQRVAKKLRHRIAWLRSDVPTITESDRVDRLEVLEAALRRLVGSGRKRAHPRGLMDLRTIEPAVRCALRAELHPARHDRSIKSLRAALAPSC